MTRRATQVTITVREVGQAFGCCATIRSAKSGRKLAETDLRPYGYDAAATDDAVALCSARGWQVAA